MAKSRTRSKKPGISQWLLSLLGIGTLAGAALIGSSLFRAVGSLDDRSQAAAIPSLPPPVVAMRYRVEIENVPRLAAGSTTKVVYSGFGFDGIVEHGNLVSDQNPRFTYTAGSADFPKAGWSLNRSSYADGDRVMVTQNPWDRVNFETDTNSFALNITNGPYHNAININVYDQVSGSKVYTATVRTHADNPKYKVRVPIQFVGVNEDVSYGARCWNTVVAGATPYWPNGCKGAINPTGTCSKGTVALTQAEFAQYSAWVAAGRPLIAGCVPGIPNITPSPVR